MQKAYSSTNGDFLRIPFYYHLLLTGAIAVMSALSFLSKKSWHTGLQTNQEAVWKAEKAALEERKKLDELRKERERERELQELERLNEESGGKNGKRQEKVDWMYQVPASIASSSQQQSASKEELEEYLLGKKRVDKLLTKGDESEKISKDGNAPAQISSSSSTKGQAGTSAPTFGDVGSDRDVASKIREDPMFAIRQQEQAAYQALLKDPTRLRAMRKAAGMDVGKEESKEERRRRKEEKRRRRDEENYSRTDRASESRHRNERDDRYTRSDYDEDRKRKSSRREEDRHDDNRSYRRSSNDRDHRTEQYSHSRHSHRHDDRRRNERFDRDRSPRRSTSPQESGRHDRREQSYKSSSPKRSYRPESSSIRAPSRSEISSRDANAEREAKLAAMQKNAVDLSSSRDAYLVKVKEQEEADLAREEALRAKVQSSRNNRSHGSGFGREAKGSFLLEQERSLYGSGGGKSGENMDLAERLRRGLDTLQRFSDDS